MLHVHVFILTVYLGEVQVGLPICYDMYYSATLFLCLVDLYTRCPQERKDLYIRTRYINKQISFFENRVTHGLCIIVVHTSSLLKMYQVFKTVKKRKKMLKTQPICNTIT